MKLGTIGQRIARAEAIINTIESSKRTAEQHGITLTIRDTGLDLSHIPAADMARMDEFDARCVAIAIDYGQRMGWGVVKHPQMSEVILKDFTLPELEWMDWFYRTYVPEVYE